MTKPAAIRATFADYKRVRTRKLGQLIFEIPLEELHEAISRLGGEPSVHNETWCAIARLVETGKGVVSDTRIESEPEHKTGAGEKQHREWRELSPAQQAGIRSNEKAFWQFLREEGDSQCDNAEKAAAYIRFACGVKSRADLNVNYAAADKWVELNDKFRAWLHDPMPA